MLHGSGNAGMRCGWERGKRGAAQPRHRKDLPKMETLPTDQLNKHRDGEELLIDATTRII